MGKSITNSIDSGNLVKFAAFIIIITGVSYARSIITPIMLALFVSIICAQPITWLQTKKVPHGLAITIVLLGILIIFFGLGELIGQALGNFLADVQNYEQSLTEMGNAMVSSLNSMGIEVSRESLAKILDPAKIMDYTAGILGQLGSLMGNVALIFFIIIFMLLEVGSFSIKAGAIIKGPVESLKYLSMIGHSIRHYLSIKTLVSLLTGVLIWISLSIIGLNYAILWGLIAFLLNYIPNIGSIIAGIPAILFSLVQFGLGGTIWTAIAYIAVNMVIGNAVEPRLMGRGMGLSTLVVFLSLIFWGFILGTVGMFLSVPLTMAFKVILEQNENTKWLAILLGTQEEAQAVLNQKQVRP